MADLYADEDFSYPAVEQLRQLGHDVLTARDAGRAGQAIADAAVLAFAIAEQRAVVTFNRRHFVWLHHQTSAHAGIIVCTRDPDDVALAGRIDDEIVKTPTLADRLLRITRPSEP